MNTRETEMIVIDLDDAENHTGRLKRIGGSQSDHWNNVLINQTCNALGLAHSDRETCKQRCSATAAALIGIGPKDEIEGMIAAQSSLRTMPPWSATGAPWPTRYRSKDGRQT
jgi:hypothetical protein